MLNSSKLFQKLKLRAEGLEGICTFFLALHLLLSSASFGGSNLATSILSWNVRSCRARACSIFHSILRFIRESWRLSRYRTSFVANY
jgi:hypothetical protein